TFKGGVRRQWAALLEWRQQAMAVLAALQEKLQHLHQECAEAGRAFQANRDRLREAECASRRGELDDQQAAMQHERSWLEEKWRLACCQLAPQTGRPAAQTLAAVDAASSAFVRQRALEDERLAFARDWAGYLQDAAPSHARRLPEYANLVAATVS